MSLAIEGFTRKFPPLKILSDEQIEQIHRGTLNVLQETGVKIYHDEALQVLKKAGCQVDLADKLAKLPPALVEESLRKCPAGFRVKSRNPENDLVIGLDNTVFVNFPGRDIVELDTWQSRIPSRGELIDLITVLDALPTVHFVVAYPYFGYAGVPEVMKELEGTAVRLAHTSKVTETVANNGIDRFAVRMADAIGTDIFACPNASSPLTCYNDQTAGCLLAAEHDLPSEIWSGATIGSSAPASITGAVISSNAEIIPYIVLIQLLNPGARVAAANFTLPQNMRTGAPAFGDIGISLFNAAFTQVWRHYRIPTVASSTGVSNSKIIGFQLGYEKTMQNIIAALSGVSILYLHSSVYGEITAHPLQVILDDDIAQMIGRFIEGVEVSEDSLAIDLIKEVGPIPGHFLGTAHTRRWWRKDQYIPKSADRLTYPEWIKQGKRSSLEYAKPIMEGILSTHKVEPPLTASQEEEIEKILTQLRQKKG